MFYGGFLENTNDDTIDVPDVDPDAFLSMLKYLYCDEIDLNPDNVLATLVRLSKLLEKISSKFDQPYFLFSVCCQEIFR